MVHTISIPILVLAAIFLLIALRHVALVKYLNLQIWHIMLLGAVVLLFTGQISPVGALYAINWDVILLLFGIFVVGRALEESGYLLCIGHRLFGGKKSADSLILSLLFGIGVASAFLLNDALAVVGTPIMLLLAKQHRISPKLLLFTLAFAITIGSAMSPIGNPQNIIVALNGNIPNQFITFFKFLLIPTMLNLFLAYGVLKLFYRKEFSVKPLKHVVVPCVSDYKLVGLCNFSIALLALMILANILIWSLAIPFDLRLTYIALVAALPILAFSPKRFKIVREINWHILIFFASMFIVMESVWATGFFQSIIAGFAIEMTSLPMIFAVSIIFSQFISNVPLVFLYLPLLIKFGASIEGMMALAAGSTIAGNLTILGAASNIIIIQNAEKFGHTLTFGEFAKIGIPLTILNILVYWLFFTVF